MYRYILLLVAALSIGHLSAQEAKATPGAFALVDVDIHTITSGVIKGGTLIIRDGKIAAIHEDRQTPSDCQVVECAGHSVYPGMIDSGTGLGMKEVGSVALTVDRNEIGNFTPHMRALTAVNPNSVLIPVNRVSGVTSVLVVPTGGAYPGTASLIHLHGYTPDQMAAGYDAVVMNFPRTGKFGSWDRRKEDKIKSDDEKKLKEFDETWKRARQYAKLDSAGQRDQLAYNPEMDALLRVIKGETALLIEVDREKEIIKALEWLETARIPNAVLSGVAEGWRVADKIHAAGVPVIVGPVLSNTYRDYDRYDAPYANAGKLAQAGVLVAIKTQEEENVRNLPYHAGFAAAYGMGKEEAMKAVTINPAKIFGLDDQIGSIEVGKLANLYVTDGDPMETATQVKYLWIRGWQVPIDSRQIRLYDEFLERSPGLKK